MAALRCMRACLAQIHNANGINKLFGNQAVRCASVWKYDYLKELYRRKCREGPEPERHPSAYGIWNYDSEMFAFGKRLGEDFNPRILQKAFIFCDYVAKEQQTREDMGMNLAPLEIEDNSQLAEKGEELATRYIALYLRHTYPYMFEEGISALTSYLMSDEVLFYISRHLGVKDLIKSADYPPSPEEFVTTFKAVIGALAESQTVETAEVFVRDFIISHLISKDINEIWELPDPMGLLVKYLKAKGDAAPEPRLLWKTGSGTVMSVYYVGIYSDKKLIGKAPGETVSIAEEMAARNALKRLMHTEDSQPPLKFNTFGTKGQFNHNFEENIRISDLEK